jgi:DNA-binding NarL/FixJ family response regulator
VAALKTFRILIADDHEVMRRGIRALIERHAHWQICGEAADGAEAVAMVRKLAPDIVILDLAMPELNGLDAMRQMLKHRAETRVLVFTLYESDQLVYDVFAAGARGYLLKSESGQHLVEAIEYLAKDKPYLGSQVGDVVLDSFLKDVPRRRHSRKLPEARLTYREREIVQMLAEGKGNKQIAEQLGISLKTVETHRATIMRKLHFHRVADLVRYAIRNRMVEA